MSPDMEERFVLAVEDLADSVKKLANPVIVAKPPKPPKPRRHVRGYESCSFCGKGKSEVTKLIAGPAVWICDLCTTLAYEMLQDTVDDVKPAGELVDLPEPT